MALLKDRRILITGLLNRRSIAFAVAAAAAREGARLAFAHQPGEKLRAKVAPIMEADFPDAPLFACDVGDDDDIKALAAAIGEKWGAIDGFLHSVAFARREALAGDYHETVSRAAFAEANDISAYSLAALAAAFAPLFSKDAAIVTMTYLGAMRAVPNYNLMGVAKAALEANVRYLAMGLGKRGVRVNAISAGPVRTLAAAGIGGFGKMLAAVAAQAPLRRNVQAEEVGDIAAFLFSPRSAAITGEIIHADCGFHITAGFPAPDDGAPPQHD